MIDKLITKMKNGGNERYRAEIYLGCDMRYILLVPCSSL